MTPQTGNYVTFGRATMVFFSCPEVDADNNGNIFRVAFLNKLTFFSKTFQTNE
jgi:hypothetical protein